MALQNEMAKLHTHIDSLNAETDDKVKEAFESASRLGDRAVAEAEAKAVEIERLEAELDVMTARAKVAQASVAELETEVAGLNDVLKRS